MEAFEVHDRAGGTGAESRALLDALPSVVG
jgi:hypothetical protein